MDYRIVADSSFDLNEDLKKNFEVGIVPLNIDVLDETFIDDGNLDTMELIEAMESSKEAVKTSSPSPAEFLKEYDKAKNIFVVSISSELSSTYSNAVLAKNLVKEDKFIHIFDSKSAAVGETLIGLKIKELIDKGLSNEEIVTETEDYIDGLNTFFVLERYDNLVKNGRMNKISASVATVLSISPIMKSNKGKIELLDKVRGKKKTMKRFVELIEEEGRGDFEDRILGISHCNALDTALKLKADIEETYNFKDIIIVETSGLTTAYADNGGIVLAY